MGEFRYTLRNLAFTLGTIIVKCGQWIVGYKEQEEGTLFGYPIVYVDRLAGDYDLNITLGGPLVQTEVEELRERIALALDGVDKGYSIDYVRNVLRDTS